MNQPLPSQLPWTAEIDCEDLVVRDIVATCFGGAFDRGDDGQTESGLKNDGSDPTLLGVALPIRSVERSTRISPLAFKGPHIPWLTPVKVWRTIEGEQTAITGRLIDNGPFVAKFPTHALDLNPNLALIFEPGYSLREIANLFEEKGFSYRIVGGARYIS